MRIRGTINGHDAAGKEWTGYLDLCADSANIINGTIRWIRHNYDGTETVNGTCIGNTLEFRGVGEVENRGRFKVVKAKHSATLVNDQMIRLKWKAPGRVPDGEASGKVTIQK